MKEFLEGLLTLNRSFRFTDLLDILIVAFIIYGLLSFIYRTRAQQLVKGLLFVIVVYIIAGQIGLNTLNWLIKETFRFGIFALVVIFQPELRRVLESIGRNRLGLSNLAKVDNSRARAIIREIAVTVESFSDTRTGALIVFEREIMLEDIIETGTFLDAEISGEMLGNIFYAGAPLHDGAAVIRGDRVLAAGCVLPLSENKNLSKSLGTRHRAGIGISEKSDALVVIVSEETGIISVAEGGRLMRYYDKESIEKLLFDQYIDEGDEDRSYNPLNYFKKLNFFKELKSRGDKDAEE